MVDCDGSTPLFCAYRYGQEGVLRILLDARTRRLQHTVKKRLRTLVSNAYPPQVRSSEAVLACVRCFEDGQLSWLVLRQYVPSHRVLCTLMGAEPI